MINQLLGALVLDVLQLLVLRKPSIITDVQFAKNITVLNADANIIKTKPVHSTESVRTTQKTIKNSKNSSQVLNLSNAQSASFGSIEFKAAVR